MYCIYHGAWPHCHRACEKGLPIYCIEHVHGHITTERVRRSFQCTVFIMVHGHIIRERVRRGFQCTVFIMVHCHILWRSHEINFIGNDQDIYP